MAPRTADSVGPERTKLISAAEVKKRGLLVVNGKVYDGQQYLERHPGGTVLTTYLGAE
jgi:cytochrome b involved in lipid metabolism